jgi:hypothetical protein
MSSSTLVSGPGFKFSHQSLKSSMVKLCIATCSRASSDHSNSGGLSKHILDLNKKLQNSYTTRLFFKGKENFHFKILSVVYSSQK